MSGHGNATGEQIGHPLSCPIGMFRATAIKTSAEMTLSPNSRCSASLTTDVGGLSENNAKSLDQQSQRQADLRFAIAVAIALALPVFVGFGVYIAAESIMLIACRISLVG